MATYDEFKYHIIWKLYHHHYIGGKHTALKNIADGLPTDEHGGCMEVAKDLIKKNWLVVKKAEYGEQISLNKKRIKEIKVFLNVKSSSASSAEIPIAEIPSEQERKPKPYRRAIVR
jgi:hypothetical protein